MTESLIKLVSLGKTRFIKRWKCSLDSAIDKTNHSKGFRCGPNIDFRFQLLAAIEAFDRS
jgi:hypothetical protein